MHIKQAIVILVLAIFISTSVCALAVEAPIEALLTVAEEEPTVVEVPQTTQASPSPAIDETETLMPSEDQTVVPTEEVTEEMASTATSEEDDVELDGTNSDGEGTDLPTPASVSINISLKWEIVTGDSSLSIGDIIKLITDVTSDAEGMQYQWQVASKPTSALTEGEAEWEDVPGATGLYHAVTVQEGMSRYRWRLKVSALDGTSVLSDEMRLPSFSEDDDAALQEDDTIGNARTVLIADPLPLANITMVSETPLDEVTYGTEITLIAEIENPRDGMLLQWQYMPSERNTSEEDSWISIEGATESEYAYVMDEENTGWIWRLLITTSEEVEEEEPLPEDADVAEDDDALPLEEDVFAEEVETSEELPLASNNEAPKEDTSAEPAELIDSIATEEMNEQVE